MMVTMMMYHYFSSFSDRLVSKTELYSQQLELTLKMNSGLILIDDRAADCSLLGKTNKIDELHEGGAFSSSLMVYCVYVVVFVDDCEAKMQDDNCHNDR
jgi:hypothetical protein